MMSFSREIADVIGVQPKEAGRKLADMGFDFPGFTLTGRKVCTLNSGCVGLWVVLAQGLDGSSVGYAGQEAGVPDAWSYRPRGTGTTFHPPKYVQEKILGLLKAVVKSGQDVFPRDFGGSNNPVVLTEVTSKAK